MKMIRRVLVAMLILAAGAVQADTCKQPEILRFVTVPKQSQQLQYEAFEPMRLHLEEVLGIPVVTIAAHSYQAVIESIVSGAVDLAEMGPASYLKASERDPGIKPIGSYSFAGGTFSPEGSYYNSLLLVRQGETYAAPEDLQGQAIALTDPNSTSGGVIPRTRFVEDTGLALDRLASHLVYAGSHDRALKALQGGQVEAAFVASREADAYIERGEAEAGEWRELWRSPPIHYDPIVSSSHLCPELTEALSQALLQPSPALDLLLKQKRAQGIVPVSAEDYRWLKPLVLD